MAKLTEQQKVNILNAILTQLQGHNIEISDIQEIVTRLQQLVQTSVGNTQLP